MNAATLQPEKPYRIREWKPASEIGFVTDAWRESFHNGGTAAQFSDRDHLYAEMRRVFERLLPGAKVLVACDRKDEDTLLGFAAATGSELHYVYVRGGNEVVNVRKQGVARDLIEAIGPVRTYTFTTIAGIRRLRPRERGWKFTPRFTL